VDFLFLLGRLFYGGFFIMAGINHFRHLSMMAGYAGFNGVPAPKLAVAGSGIIVGIGGLCVLLGCAPTWGVACIVLFLVPVTLMMHRFWADKDPQAKINNLVNFQKNVALLGAALLLLFIPQPWPMSLSF
jgi:uncharacterized membrane protein YphA (DoxX/SURF4 family)